MRRTTETPRQNYEELVKAQGLLWPNQYWLENASYSLKRSEVDMLEKMSAKLWTQFLAAGQRVVDEKLWSRFGLTPEVGEQITASWNAEPPAIYGRFDIAWNNGSPKLLEFNADTPTGLVEAAVCQWEWKQDKYSHLDQWNSIHDYLIEKWKDVKDYVSPVVHFTSMRDGLYEDLMTVAYMQEVAEQAGIRTKYVQLEDIQLEEKMSGSFFTDGEQAIQSIFKLYPWEWLIQENPHYDKADWIEPIWKMMFSNKEILVILSEMFPEDEHIPFALSTPFARGKYVQKAKLGREGQNVIIKEGNGLVASKGGQYGEEGFIYQEYVDLGNFDGNIPVLGCWVVDGTPAGLGIRESNDLITGNTARFVPHIIEG